MAVDLAASPVVAEQAIGLEVASWGVRVGESAFARAVLRYEGEPVPMDASVRDLWRANGLRLLSVPVDELNGLLASLASSGAVQREWIGQTGAWREIASGPEHGRAATVALDAERLRLPSGRLRLLTRAWVAPVPPANALATRSAEAILTVEVLPQHREASSQTGLLGVAPSAAGAEREGLVFTRLLARLTVDARDERAFVVVGERPGADWAAAAAIEDAAPAVAGSAEAPAEAAAPPVGRVTRRSPGRVALAGGGEPDSDPGGVGPEAPTVPTLGEAMLSTGGRRSLVVLIPRVPGEYRLLAAPAPASE